MGLREKKQEEIEKMKIKKNNFKFKKLYARKLVETIKEENPELLTYNFSFMQKYKLSLDKNAKYSSTEKLQFCDKKTGDIVENVEDLDLGIEKHGKYAVSKREDGLYNLDLKDNKYIFDIDK
jgi:hypothetical protein